MRSRPNLPLLAAAAGLLLLAAAGPVAADWLVMTDGSRVETAGPWQVEGRLVVFDLPDGTRASLRTSQVDLEASRQATEAAQRRAEEEAEGGDDEGDGAPAAERRASRRITNADIGPGRRTTGATDEAAEGEGEGGDEESRQETGDEPASADDLEIAAWESGYADDGSAVFTVRVANRGDVEALGVRVVAHVYDTSGERIASVVSARSLTLAPGEEDELTVEARDVYTYMAVDFEIRARRLSSTPRTEDGSASPDTADTADAAGS